MKTSIMMGVLALAFAMNPKTENQKDENAISNSIVAFMKAGDEQNVTKLETLLDTEFRVVMNRLFGSKTVSSLNREAYLDKISNKEFGGDSRKVKIETIIVNENTATAKVKTEGAKMSMSSLLSLVEDDMGNWKIVEDLPVILQN